MSDRSAQPRYPRPSRALRSFLAGLLALACTASLAVAAEFPDSQTIQGLTVYLGVVPAQLRQPAHGATLARAHEYDVMVAVFDAATGARIQDAKVGARVAAAGLTGNYKVLGPMTMADAQVYGNLFDFPDRGPYAIEVDIDRPGQHVSVKFEHGH